MRTLLRWSVAFGVVAFAVFAARRVYSSCQAPKEERLELEIESVTRGGSEVEDLSPWKTYESRDIQTLLEARGESVVLFGMRHNGPTSVEIFAEKSKSGSGEK